MPPMFLNGGGMRGGTLHHLLAGATLVAETRTAPRYRLYSAGDRYPVMQPSPDGAAIAGEVYDLPLDILRDRLLPAEPPELELGVIELEDGSAALGMLLRRPCPATDDLTDITSYRGWRAYLDRHDDGDGLPANIGAPATRALTGSGYTGLGQLAGVPAAELKKLHGIGPKALRLLQEALQARGKSLG